MSLPMSTTGIILLTFVFSYLIVYKKNRFAGNIFFMVEGLGIAYFDVNLIYLGILMFMGGLVSFIYDWMKQPEQG